jgi:hypothetical protein
MIISSNVNSVSVSCTNNSSGGGSSGGGGGGSGGGGAPSVPIVPVNDITPPGIVTNLYASSSEKEIKLFWINPSDSDFVGVKIYRKIGSALTGYTDPLASVVYQGNASSFADVYNFERGQTYYYSIYSYDAKPNYSSARTTSVRFEFNGIILETESTQPSGDTATTNPDSDVVTSLIGAGSAVVERVTTKEAKQLVEESTYVELTEAEKKIYTKIVALATRTLTSVDKYAIAWFIHVGTPTTRILGAGERGGSVASFHSAFGRLPANQLDWQDVLKIANGRWTTQKSVTAENAAKVQFKKIYGRDPKMSNQNDNAAVTVMAYGLRPALRNTNSEKVAIKAFKYYYNVYPTSARDWDIVRAIAYSGAKR